ncbi:hypothetical protein [Caulobacter sp. B11]|uniref:hypothetical protein n=1 Tax=Caulobacter sp. B11 TaxID=2048899 RepID=UPI001374768E|nr:hypothetical protein [Caulobacter sp. B11]
MLADFASQSQQAGRIGNAAWSESDFNDEITSFGPERTAMSQLSKRVVTEAGKIIRGRPSLCDETIEAFRTAHAWREAHAIPMRKVRLELGLRARRIDIGSIVAGRLKRMQSIRRKMERHTVTLHQMQDIAGCRAIVGSVAEVDQLMEIYRAGASRHKVRRIYDYASSPKPSGYRSQHLVMEFQGKDEDAAFDGRLIELQVRTTLQHAWATAVEAVGLVRAEELKSGRGSTDWLRLFTLMARNWRWRKAARSPTMFLGRPISDSRSSSKLPIGLMRYARLRALIAPCCKPSPCLASGGNPT